MKAEPKSKELKLKCDKCGKVWMYKGKNNVMATCPDCMKKVNITLCKVSKAKVAQ